MIFYLLLSLIINLCGMQTLFSSPIEYLYPVAYNKQQDAVYLMYQKSPDSLELWFWNPTTKLAAPGLLSRFTPAALRILPSGKAFSFVDNGIIKVQSLLKRSPQRIELSHPLYDITLLEWITDDVCYLSAKERSHYGIYQINREGEVVPLVVHAEIDCLYPQKIGDSLFYIERLSGEGSQQHRIMQVEYKTVEFPVDEKTEGIITQEGEVVWNFDRAISFLYMASETCGYAVSYPNTIKRTDALINCEYYQLTKQKAGEWSILRLFSFCIPTRLLFTHKDSRLYESIIPLLPKHNGNHIYYNSVPLYSENLSVYSYDCVAGTSNICLSSSVAGQDYFVPLFIGSTLYSGGRVLISFASITDYHTNALVNNVIPLYMEAIETGGVEIGLPSIQSLS